MFQDRTEAGQRLARSLADKDWEFDVVLGIPRGGVVIARQVADYFGCLVDVVLARKIGSPANPEHAIGAVTPDGEVLMDERLREFLGLETEDIKKAAEQVQQEINRRLDLYRSGRDRQPLKGKRCILVDDGIATGFTVKAAVQYLRRQGAKSIVVAVPVAAPEAFECLKDSVDGFLSLELPEVFFAVGQFYRDFAATDDEEVIKLLGKGTVS